MLRKLEIFACFAAAMMAIITEGACVYWMWTHGDLRPGTSTVLTQVASPTNLVGQWTGTTLPQCWILGAILVLLYRVGRMVAPPAGWDRDAKLGNRQAFMRVWRWVMALTLVEGFALYLGVPGVAQ